MLAGFPDSRVDLRVRCTIPDQLGDPVKVLVVGVQHRGGGRILAVKPPFGSRRYSTPMAVRSPGFIAEGGLELGYCLTAHKAEGLTVDGRCTCRHGSVHEGSVLVRLPGWTTSGCMSRQAEPEAPRCCSARSRSWKTSANA